MDNSGGFNFAEFSSRMEGFLANKKREIDSKNRLITQAVVRQSVQTHGASQYMGNLADLLNWCNSMVRRWGHSFVLPGFHFPHHPFNLMTSTRTADPIFSHVKFPRPRVKDLDLTYEQFLTQTPLRPEDLDDTQLLSTWNTLRITLICPSAKCQKTKGLSSDRLVEVLEAAIARGYSRALVLIDTFPLHPSPTSDMLGLPADPSRMFFLSPQANRLLVLPSLIETFNKNPPRDLESAQKQAATLLTDTLFRDPSLKACFHNQKVAVTLILLKRKPVKEEELPIFKLVTLPELRDQLAEALDRQADLIDRHSEPAESFSAAVLRVFQSSMEKLSLPGIENQCHMVFQLNASLRSLTHKMALTDLQLLATRVDLSSSSE